ncbi:MAG: 23S rRNA pseudouridine(955/2504/2580) synthase [Gammaproteobacteria bacterium]|nr:23S rRNA pseudouridine(955/2504/2580) synthase [Gammaproteobacteria bacterium]|tara:strand:+ start:2143 stop:3072 length:930 start_codon:yes stop_codon:yes gene_type:complete
MNKESNNIFKAVSTYIVDEDYDGVRLDNCLFNKLKGVPKSRVYSMIRKGEVRINGSRSKPEFRLKVGQKIRIPPYNIKPLKPYKPDNSVLKMVKEKIIYDKDNILVIDKPEGLASHGGSGLKLGLIEAVRQIDKRFQNAQLVHRLDKDTSGCIVLTLKKSILRSLNEEIREGKVEKKYLAVVFGRWPNEKKIINLKLKKNILSSGERKVNVSEEGKDSTTKFKILKTNENLTLLECELITGRMHQIRVQVNNEGFPIVGDLKYGTRKINDVYKEKGVTRMLLHSTKINFINLGLTFKSEAPKIFSEILT